MRRGSGEAGKLAVAALLIAAPLAAQDSVPVAAEPDKHGIVPAAVVGGVAGAWLGAWGLGTLGAHLGETTDEGDLSEDLALGVVGSYAGIVVGSFFGSSLGSALGNAAAGHPGVSFGRRIKDAAEGMIFGAALGGLTSLITDGSDAPFTVYISVQGLFAGLSNGRW
jgi:hypothetical protein